MKEQPGRTKVDYYKVEGSPGGSQDWFEDYWMRIGGCGALTACDLSICLAKNMGWTQCCPFDPRHISREDYISFGMTMKRYIRPRPGGVIRIATFTSGLNRYLKSCGLEARFAVCRGKEDYETACRFVKTAIGRGLPVSILLLKHKDSRFKNISWHWFTITGYVFRGDRMKIAYHTYGGVFQVDFYDLWHTGKLLKGGMVTVDEVKRV